MKNNIEDTLRTLRNVKPDSTLHKRIHTLACELPDLRTQSAVPLLVFRLALTGIVLLLLGSVGTGVLLAAKGSNPGSVLYPLKLVVDTSHVPFFSNPVATPTAALPNIQEIHHTIQVSKENERNEGISSQSAHDTKDESVHQTESGAGSKQDKQEKDIVHPTAIPSLLQDISPVMKLHTDEQLEK